MVSKKAKRVCERCGVWNKGYKSYWSGRCFKCQAFTIVSLDIGAEENHKQVEVKEVKKNTPSTPSVKMPKAPEWSKINVIRKKKL